MKKRNTHFRHPQALRNLPQRLLQARDRLMSHFRPILNHYGITDQQWRILRALDERGELEPRELCELCQVVSSNMVGILARMEAAQLVQRERMPEDQRRVTVRLAVRGDALLSEIAPLITEQYKYVEQAYGSPALDDLFKALEAFTGEDTPDVRTVELPRE